MICCTCSAVSMGKPSPANDRPAHRPQGGSLHRPSTRSSNQLKSAISLCEGGCGRHTQVARISTSSVTRPCEAGRRPQVSVRLCSPPTNRKSSAEQHPASAPPHEHTLLRCFPPPDATTRDSGRHARSSRRPLPPARRRRRPHKYPPCHRPRNELWFGLCRASSCLLKRKPAFIYSFPSSTNRRTFGSRHGCTTRSVFASRAWCGDGSQRRAIGGEGVLRRVEAVACREFAVQRTRRWRLPPGRATSTSVVFRSRITI